MMRHLLIPLFAIATVATPQSHKLVNSGYAPAMKALQLAEKGDPVMQYEYALICERGEGVPQSHAKAVKWFRQSATQDYAPAQLFLGLMYASGKGVSRNMGEALRWVHLAAEQDDSTAQFYLGGVYFSGSVTPENYVQAYKWFSLAGRQDPLSAQRLAGLRKQMTPMQVLEGERLVAAWSPRASR